MKSRPQLDTELYSILSGNDIRPALNLCSEIFPKSKGKISNLNNNQLQQLIDEIKKRGLYAP